MLNFAGKMGEEIKRTGRRSVHFHPSEKDMLTSFLARYQSLDPDIVVAHNASGSFMELLVSRMQSIGVSHFSRIGRLKQTRLRTLTAGSAGTWLSR